MQVWGMIWSEQRDGSPHAETFVKLPKRIQIAVWDDSYHSQIMRFWIPAFAGMTDGGRGARIREDKRVGICFFLWWKRMVGCVGEKMSFRMREDNGRVVDGGMVAGEGDLWQWGVGSGEMGREGDGILRLRCAALRMKWEGAGTGSVPACART